MKWKLDAIVETLATTSKFMACLALGIIMPLCTFGQAQKGNVVLGNRPIVVYAAAELYHVGVGVKVPLKKRIDFETSALCVIPYYYNAVHLDPERKLDFYGNRKGDELFFKITQLGAQAGYLIRAGITVYPQHNNYNLFFYATYRNLFFEEEGFGYYAKYYNPLKIEHAIGFHGDFNIDFTKSTQKFIAGMYVGIGIRITTNRSIIFEKWNNYSTISHAPDLYIINKVTPSFSFQLGFKIGGRIKQKRERQ